MKSLILTYALTYGGALVSLLNPYYGFLIYVVFANIKPDALWSWSVPQGNYSRTVAIAFLLGWALHGFGSWQLGRAKAIVVWLIAFWGWLLLSAQISPVQAEAWHQFIELSKCFLPVIAGITLLDSVRKLKQLAWVLVLSEGFLAYEINLQYYAGQFDPNEWNFAGLDNNGIAICMVAAVGMAYFLGANAEKWWQKAVAFLLAALMAHVVLFSMSRGGMLAGCITGVTAFLIIPKRPVHLLYFACAIAVIIRLAGPAVIEEFNTTFVDEENRDKSAQSRFDLTKNALDCFSKNPIFGCGMENWGNKAPEYGWQVGKEVHNTWAQLAAELGFFGILSIACFYTVGCWRLFRVIRDKSGTYDPWLIATAQMVLATLTGFVVSAAAVSVEGIELPYYTMTLGAGALKILSQQRIEDANLFASEPSAGLWRLKAHPA